MDFETLITSEDFQYEIEEEAYSYYLKNPNKKERQTTTMVYLELEYPDSIYNNSENEFIIFPENKIYFLKRNDIDLPFDINSFIEKQKISDSEEVQDILKMLKGEDFFQEIEKSQRFKRHIEKLDDILNIEKKSIKNKEIYSFDFEKTYIPISEFKDFILEHKLSREDLITNRAFLVKKHTPSNLFIVVKYITENFSENEKKLLLKKYSREKCDDFDSEDFFVPYFNI